VKDSACASPIELPRLLEYWLGELSREESETLEEHYLSCAACAGRLEELSGLASAIREGFRGGAIRAVVTPSIAETMKRDGMRLREYRVAPGGTVECTIHAADDAVIGRLQAPLAGVRRLDAICTGESGEGEMRLEDIPFDPRSGEVLFCPAAAPLKARPAFTERWRLVAVDAAGERAIGEYTFVHAPG
jgi:hypothetical protein